MKEKEKKKRKLTNQLTTTSEGVNQNESEAKEGNSLVPPPVYDCLNSPIVTRANKRWGHDQHAAAAAAAALVEAPRRLLRRRTSRTDNIGGNRVQAITGRRLDRPSMDDVPIAAAAASRDRLRRHLHRINK